MPRLRANLVSVYIVRTPPEDPSREALRLLLLQRPDDYRFPGDWQGVHGHIEGQEAAWQAAVRETEEETGLSIRRWWRLLRLESFYNPENDSIYQIPAFLAEAQDDAEPRLSAEHQAFRWCSLEEAPSLFAWETQQASLAAIVASVDDWPQTGTGLMKMDIQALGRRRAATSEEA